MKKLFVLFLSTLFLLISCSRTPFTISKIELYPTVVASHNKSSGISTLSEALSLLLFDGSFEDDKEYEITLISPSKEFSWSTKATPITIKEAPSLLINSFLMPEYLSLESGNYLLQLYLDDGRLFEYPITFSYDDSLMNKALTEVSTIEEPTKIFDAQKGLFLISVDNTTD